MIASIPFSPRYAPTVFLRSTARHEAVSPELRPSRPSSSPSKQSLFLLPGEDRVTGGMLIALMTITLPAAAYSLMQAWNLVGSDALSHAVRAFIP